MFLLSSLTITTALCCYCEDFDYFDCKSFEAIPSNIVAFHFQPDDYNSALVFSRMSIISIVYDIT